jgi:hypothetical protein
MNATLLLDVEYTLTYSRSGEVESIGVLLLRPWSSCDAGDGSDLGMLWVRDACVVECCGFTCGGAEGCAVFFSDA